MSEHLNCAEFVLSNALGDRLVQRSTWLFRQQEATNSGDASYAALIGPALDELDTEIGELRAAIRAAFPNHTLYPLPPRTKLTTAA